MSGDLVSIRVRARGLVGFPELVAKHGGDCHALLKSVGIEPELLNTPDATLEHIKLIELFEKSAHDLNVADFGLQLAQLQGISVLGPVALLAQHAATVGDAIEAVHRNIRYHSPGASARLHFASKDVSDEQDEMVCYRYELQLPDGVPHRQNTELAYAIALKFLTLVSSAKPDQWRVHFAHDKGLSAKQYRRHLGCQVKLGQSFDACFFPKRLLGVAIHAADPALVDTAQRFVSHVIRRHPLDLAKQIETLLIRQLASGGCTLPRLAKQLSLSARTMQRHLQSQGGSFDEIVDRVRKMRAAEYLRDSTVPLAQVSNLLGYTESSTFNRSCVRWFDETPLAYRRRLQSA